MVADIGAYPDGVSDLLQYYVCLHLTHLHPYLAWLTTNSSSSTLVAT